MPFRRGLQRLIEHIMYPPIEYQLIESSEERIGRELCKSVWKRKTLKEN